MKTPDTAERPAIPHRFEVPKFCPACAQPCELKQTASVRCLFADEPSTENPVVRAPIWWGVCTACGWRGEVHSHECEPAEDPSDRAMRSPATRTIFFCGTTPCDLDPDNGGPVDIYMSPEALRDHAECVEECGIQQAELILGPVLVPPQRRQGMSAAEARSQENEVQALYDKLAEFCAHVPRRTALAAARWLTATHGKSGRRAQSDARSELLSVLRMREK